jgi:hypothetical protein
MAYAVVAQLMHKPDLTIKFSVTPNRLTISTVQKKLLAVNQVNYDGHLKIRPTSTL